VKVAVAVVMAAGAAALLNNYDDSLGNGQPDFDQIELPFVGVCLQ
jgi:hypothetical protein